MADYRVTLRRGLPMVDDRDWDAGPAKARVFDWATSAGGEFDAARAADAFLIADPSTGLKGDLHMPVADIIDGRLTIVGNALRAARSRFGQGFPEGIPADVRDRANDRAGELLDELNERQDGDGSIGVMVPIPARLAESFPSVDGNGPPHVTVVYCGEGDDAIYEKVVACCRSAAKVMLGERMSLGPLGYFDGLTTDKGDRAAFATVDASDRLRGARDLLERQLADAGVDVKRYGGWKPHATLAYLGEGDEYGGPVPSGEWPVDGLLVWRGDTYTLVDEFGRLDKLAHRGGKWLALSADGEKVLGTYDTEAEARERLRQVEAAKAARDDGIDLDDVRMDARSDEEKAEIRSRWASGEGPNMGPAALETWLESDFAGPNRKTGDARDRARRVADRALRVMRKSTADWTDRDYTAALQIMAFIARMKDVEQGEPLTIDGREGPSARDAALRDWGYDPAIAERSDGVLTVYADGSVQVGGGGAVPADQLELALTAASRAARTFAAPAVHTESRNTFEAMRLDRATLLPPETLANGWRRVPVLYSKTGTQEYVIGGKKIREGRLAADVFDRRSMDSGVGIPWELRHSASLLTPNDVLGVARGCLLSVEKHTDGIHTAGHGMAWDRGLLEAIEGPAPEVSVAFRCKIDPRPGTDDFGERFDRRQFQIVWNSLASEPKGRAGSARVLSDRLDASDIVVHGASDLLAYARSERIPSRPIYYDLRGWVRYDSASRTQHPTEARKDQDPMNKLLKALIMAHGMSEADLAEKSGIAAEDLMKIMSGEMEASEEQIAMLVKVLMPMREDMEHGMSDKDKMMEVMIGEEKMDAHPKIAAHVANLTERLTIANERADAMERKARKLEAIDKERQDAMQDMIPRQDADKMVQDQALAYSRVIALARKANADDWTPEVRQDADGNEIVPVLRDWQRGLFRGVYGEDEAKAMIERFDAAPDAAQDTLYQMRVDEAETHLRERANHSQSQRTAINRMRDTNAKRDQARVDSAAGNELLAARQAALRAAQQTKTATPTNGA